MKQTCKFRKGADITETVQGLQVNIPQAIDYSRVKDTSVPSSYNGQKDVSEVGDRIREPFDVIEYDRSYTRLRKYINDSEYAKKQEENKK